MCGWLRRIRDDGAVTLERAAWMVTVAALLVGGVILLVSGYQGYAALSGAVALSAAINLR